MQHSLNYYFNGERLSCNCIRNFRYLLALTRIKWKICRRIFVSENSSFLRKKILFVLLLIPSFLICSHLFVARTVMCVILPKSPWIILPKVSKLSRSIRKSIRLNISHRSREDITANIVCFTHDNEHDYNSQFD